MLLVSSGKLSNYWEATQTGLTCHFSLLHNFTGVLIYGGVTRVGKRPLIWVK